MALPSLIHAIRNMAHECVQRFESIEAKYDSILLREISPEIYLLGNEIEPTFTFSSTRETFDLWIDDTAILSPNPSSLDFNTEGSEVHSQLILKALDRMSKSLASIDKPSTIPSVAPTPDFIETFEDVTRSVHAAVDRLRRVARGLRGLRTRNFQASMAIFDSFTKKDFVFRDYITHLIRRRFPAAGAQLHALLGESVAVRRRRLLDKRLRTRKIATRRASRDGHLVERHHEGMLPNLSLDASLPTQNRAADHLKGSGNGLSEVFLPDNEDERFIISTVHLSKDDCFEYPPTPVIAEGETRTQCPFCSDELELGSNTSWKDHLHKDLTPYPCFIPECAAGLISFESRIEWKTHMRTRHYSDWICKVVPKWCCGIDHDQLQTFRTEREWRKHIQEVESHDPKRTLPTKAQLDHLAKEIHQISPSREFLCPLCRRVPKNIEELLDKDSTSSIMTNNLLLDHIASHLESLSLKALPPLPPPSLDGSAVDQLSNQRPPSGERDIDKTISSPMIDWLMVSDESSYVSSMAMLHKFDVEDPDEITSLLTRCPCCGQNAIEGAIPLPKAARFLTPDEMAFFTKSGAETGSLRNCPCCGRDANEGVLVPDEIRKHQIERKLPLTIGFIEKPPYYECSTCLCSNPNLGDSVPDWFDIWASWRMRHHPYPQMDPILICCTHDSFFWSRRPLSGLPEDPNFNFRTGRPPSPVPDDEDFSANHKLNTFSYSELLLMASQVAGCSEAKYFIQKGANVNTFDHHGMTPLLWATVLGYENVVQVLLENNASIDQRDKTFDRTPLSLAALRGHEAIVKLLLNAGANVQSCDSSNRTPLFWAVSRGHVSVVKSLLAFGARHQESVPFFPMGYPSCTSDSLLDLPTMESLWSAIDNRFESTVKELLETHYQSIHELHADSGKTFMDSAVETGNWNIIQMLLEYDVERVQRRSLGVNSRLFKTRVGGRKLFLQSTEFTR